MKMSAFCCTLVIPYIKVIIRPFFPRHVLIFRHKHVCLCFQFWSFFAPLLTSAYTSRAFSDQLGLLFGLSTALFFSSLLIFSSFPIFRPSTSCHLLSRASSSCKTTCTGFLQHVCIIWKPCVVFLALCWSSNPVFHFQFQPHGDHGQMSVPHITCTPSGVLLNFSAMLMWSVWFLLECFGDTQDFLCIPLWGNMLPLNCQEHADSQSSRILAYVAKSLDQSKMQGLGILNQS